MKATDILFQELETTANELYHGHPPRIELQGWWWKKYIPFYRRQQKVMQYLIDMRWSEMRDQYHDQIERERMSESMMFHKANRF